MELIFAQVTRQNLAVTSPAWFNTVAPSLDLAESYTAGWRLKVVPELEQSQAEPALSVPSGTNILTYIFQIFHSNQDSSYSFLILLLGK